MNCDSQPPAVVFPPKHLLVAVDFSPCSAGATRAAVRLARTFGVTLSVVHVLAPVAEDPEVVLVIKMILMEREEVIQWVKMEEMEVIMGVEVEGLLIKMA